LLVDGDTLAVGGSWGFPFPRSFSLRLRSALGGLNRLAHEGLIRRAIGGHWGLVPALGALASSGRIEASCLRQDVLSQLYRETAAGRPDRSRGSGSARLSTRGSSGCSQRGVDRGGGAQGQRRLQELRRRFGEVSPARAPARLGSLSRPLPARRAEDERRPMAGSRRQAFKRPIRGSVSWLDHRHRRRMYCP
jgi:hypothetical protein